MNLASRLQFTFSMIQLTPQITNQHKKQSQRHFRVAEKDFPSFEFQAKLVDSHQELANYQTAWKRLAEIAVHGNPFLGSGYLLPALEHLADDSVSVLVVTARPRVNPEAPEVLCALMPLERKRMYGMPLSCFEIWKHDQCFDCTPLIRKDCAKEVWKFALEYLAQQNTKLLSLDTVSAEGDFANLLIEHLYSSDQPAFYRDRFTRACFKPLDDSETYIKAQVSPKTRKSVQRLRRKLAKQGVGEVRTQFTYQYDDKIVRAFLELEAAGWKGKSQTAFQSSPNSQAFFESITKRLFASQKMVAIQTFLGDKRIAIAFDLLEGDRAAHYKIAYDESLREFSPGLILELDNIQRLHDDELLARPRYFACALVSA